MKNTARSDVGLPARADVYNVKVQSCNGLRLKTSLRGQPFQVPEYGVGGQDKLNTIVNTIGN